MGRGRYNGRDHWQQDEDGYEDRSVDRYTDDTDEEDRSSYEDEDDYEPPSPPRRRASEIPYSPPRVRRTRNVRHAPPPTRDTYSRPQRRPPRKRSFWPALLGGCALGVFTVVLAAALIVVFALHNLQNGGTIATIPGLPGLIALKPFSKDETQKIPLSQVSQILVCDQVGNVTLHVDPTIDTPTITTKKTVRAANQGDANKALQQIIVEVQPPTTITHPLTCVRSQATPTTTSATPALSTASAITPTASALNAAPSTSSTSNTTLTINVLFPNTDTFSHSVDLNIAFPPSVLSSAAGPSIPVDVEAPIGNINVDGLSGLLNIRGGTGNVTVTHAILVDGSHIETAQGNVTFNGYLAAPQTDATGVQYIIQSEHNVDVTLPSNTNVILDANTNVGKITSDFPIAVTNDNGAMNYNGPLNSTSSIKPTSTLILDVSTGNITIHRSQ